MILFVRLEVLIEHGKAAAQQCNLNLWRPSIGLVALIGLGNLPLYFNCQCHSGGIAPCLLFSRFGT
jgi:hypothetical protein